MNTKIDRLVSLENVCDLLVLGGGPGGYSAAFRAADLGLKVILVERNPSLGGVCLNVGCIPSKALLHVTGAMEEVRHLADAGIDFGKPLVNLSKLRNYREKVVGKLTGGLAAMAKMRGVQVIRGEGFFIGTYEAEVSEKNGNKKSIRFRAAIIAAGSEALRLPFLPSDPRIVDSTGALALEFIPRRMLILGGGIIGLEMGTVYSALGSRLDVVEMSNELMPGAESNLVRIWQKKNAHRFDRIMLDTKAIAANAAPEGITVQFENNKSNTQSTGVYDLVLQSVGRTPNGLKVGAETIGIAVTERGFVNVDQQMRTNIPHIFAVGDIVGQPMLAHKAVHQAHVAAEVIAGDLHGIEKLARSAFCAEVIPNVAYTNPEIAWVGLTEDQAKRSGRKIKSGIFPWTASGRAIAMGCEEGVTTLIFDDSPDSKGHGRILGGGIVGKNAGDLIGEVVLAIEMGATAVDIGKTIHPHPTLSESIGLAAEVVHGSCTDLPASPR